MKTKFGYPVVFYSCAGIAALGLLLTLALTIDTREVVLEKVDEAEKKRGSINTKL